MKKRIITVMLAALLVYLAALPAAAAAPEDSAGSAILIDALGGETLYEKHADRSMLIASTTKIMTALVVLENRRLDEKITIKPEWTGIEGSSMYLTAGETLTVEELLYGLLLASGNDAAAALACDTAGSIESFAKLMNERAASLGLTATSFKNPHGLDAQGHCSTARELAIITQAAMENDTFRKIVSTKNASVAGRSFRNHNRLLWECDGAIGVKTGYTKSAGRILVSCAERGGFRLICVTISDPDDWNDHKALYDWAFASYRRAWAVPEELKELSVPVISGVSSSVRVRAEGDFSVLLGEGESIEASAELPRFVYAGVYEGAAAGRITITKNGKPLGMVDLVFDESVARDEGLLLTPAERLLSLFSRGK